MKEYNKFFSVNSEFFLILFVLLTIGVLIWLCLYLYCKKNHEEELFQNTFNLFKTGLILPVTLAVLAIIFTISKNIEEKKAEQITAEKADQMYYEEMFSQPKMNLAIRNPTIIIPAYDEMFILRHPELKKYFVREVSPQEIFSTKLNIDFSDGTWKLSVNERTTELVKAQFSRDGKFVLVSGMKEGNSIINISREDEAYNFSIFVKVEEPEEWYEKLQEEIKFES